MHINFHCNPFSVTRALPWHGMVPDTPLVQASFFSIFYKVHLSTTAAPLPKNTPSLVLYVTLQLQFCVLGGALAERKMHVMTVFWVKSIL